MVAGTPRCTTCVAAGQRALTRAVQVLVGTALGDGRRRQRVGSPGFPGALVAPRRKPSCRRDVGSVPEEDADAVRGTSTADVL